MSGFIAFRRPETGAVGCQHFIADHHVAILVQTELKLGIRNDDPLAQRVLCTFFVQGDGVVTKLFSKLLPSAREIFFQMRNALLKGNIFVVIADFRFGGGRVNRLRQLIGFF